MERYRLKNIIILILALLNAFLLVSLGIRGTEQRAAVRTQRQELVALFAADGMTLDPALIPESAPPSACTLIRDETLEQRAAAFWLDGASERTEQGGGIYTYSTDHGAAIFRDTGSFDIAGTLSDGDAQARCETFCKEFSYTEPVFTLDENGSGTATAQRLWNGAPVANGTVTFSLEQGNVTTVSGALLPDARTDSADQTLLTAFAALTAFQQMRHESSFVVSAITEISLCYELQSTAAAPMTLVPAWCIETDTATFYVNSSSGVVRRA